VSSDELPPLPPDLRVLFASEKRAGLDVPSPEATAAVSTALASVLGSVPTALPPVETTSAAQAAGAALTVARGSRLALLAKTAAVFMAGAGVGAGVAVNVPRAPEVRIVERVVERTVELPAAPAPSASVSAAPMDVQTPRGKIAPPPSSPTSAASDASLRRERVLIERASSAIARQDGTAALAALDEHRTSFPNGRLTEEREALAIHALVLAKRLPEARTRAKRFRESFPDGLFLPVVEAALQADSPP
jgi:hypothetical protein